MPKYKINKKAYIKRVDKFIANQGKFADREIKNMIGLVKNAQNNVVQQIRNLNISEWKSWYLPQIQMGLNEQLGNLQRQLIGQINSAQNRLFDDVLDQTDELIKLAGIEIPPVYVSSALLDATQSLTGELISTVPQQLRQKLGNDVSLALLQGKSNLQTIEDISNTFKLSFGEADRIARTEINRTQGIAQHKRFQQVKEFNPGVKHGWRSSHKPNAREGHLEAEMNYSLEKAIPLDQPFRVRPTFGKPYELLQFPRDPAGSAANVVYCGCGEMLTTGEE